MRHTSSVFALAAFAALIEGCASKKPEVNVEQSASPVCTPVVGTLPSNVSLDSIAGEFRLTLVGASDRNSGRTTTGALTLSRRAGASELTGRSNVAIEALGAAAPGGRPSDGFYPLTAVQWTRVPGNTQEITIRFGTPTPQAIEGAHMALHLKSRSAAGFNGTWVSSSGQSMSDAVAGHFCADRLP